MVHHMAGAQYGGWQSFRDECDGVVFFQIWVAVLIHRALESMTAIRDSPTVSTARQTTGARLTRKRSYTINRSSLGKSRNRKLPPLQVAIVTSSLEPPRVVSSGQLFLAESIGSILHKSFFRLQW
jgi:hypothetical protein